MGNFRQNNTLRINIWLIVPLNQNVFKNFWSIANEELSGGGVVGILHSQSTIYYMAAYKEFQTE